MLVDYGVHPWTGLWVMTCGCPRTRWRIHPLGIPPTDEGWMTEYTSWYHEERWGVVLIWGAVIWQ